MYFTVHFKMTKMVNFMLTEFLPQFLKILMVKTVNCMCIVPQFLKEEQKFKKTNHAKTTKRKQALWQKSMTGSKEGCFIMMVCFIHQEDITVLNLCVPNTHSLKIQKAKPWTELQEGRDKSTNIVEDAYISNC